MRTMLRGHMLAAVILARCSAAAPAPVELALYPAVGVGQATVRVADIAQLRSGSASLRDAVGNLDVAGLPAEGMWEQIDRQRLAIRLRLAGIEDSQFQIQGADQTIVRRAGERLNERLVADLVRGAVAARIRVPAADVDVQVTEPVSESTADFELPAGMSVRPLLPAQLVRLGRMRLRLGLYHEDTLTQTVTVTVDVRAHRTAAQATRTILPGEVLDDQNVTDARVPVHQIAEFLLAADVRGKAAAHRIPAGQPLTRFDVRSATTTLASYAVKPRDAVRIIARTKNLSVIVSSAEVLQRGRVGDTVAVRNPTSGKVIQARVVRPGEVEVDL